VTPSCLLYCFQATHDACALIESEGPQGEISLEFQLLFLPRIELMNVMLYPCVHFV
jgi:hypothetical protein